MTARAAEDQATMLTETPERLTIGVHAARPAYLVLADAFAPGWRALVDGRPSPVLRADGLFRAVQVPAGRHDVDLIYRPAGVVEGAALSLAGVLIACATGVVLMKRGR